MADIDDDVEVDRPHHYSSIHPDFSIQFSKGTAKAVNGVLKLTDEENKELNKLLKSGNRPDLMQVIKKLDYAEAERVAREFLASRRPDATQGAHNTNGQKLSVDGNTQSLDAGSGELKPAPELKSPEGTPVSVIESIRARQRANAAQPPAEETALHAEDAKLNPEKPKGTK